jgi:hypothetical protein
MTDADELLREAEHCRQQASVADALTRRVLLELADHFEAEARFWPWPIRTLVATVMPKNSNKPWSRDEDERLSRIKGGSEVEWGYRRCAGTKHGSDHWSPQHPQYEDLALEARAGRGRE